MLAEGQVLAENGVAAIRVRFGSRSKGVTVNVRNRRRRSARGLAIGRKPKGKGPALLDGPEGTFRET